MLPLEMFTRNANIRVETNFDLKINASVIEDSGSENRSDPSSNLLTRRDIHYFSYVIYLYFHRVN